MNLTDAELKQDIIEKAHSLGANIVRSCSVAKWEEIPIQKPGFWPQNIWPWAKNVIVLAVPLFVPMMATTPSMVYQELYDTSNRVLDDMAYHLTNYITTKYKCRALYFPRDCYFNISVLVKNPNAAFSHVIAGYYAGVGTIGDSHNLLSKEFGPRMRLVSIITDLDIPEDKMLEKNLCLHCKKCMKNCPSKCFSKNGKDIYKMDKVVCTEYHVDLVNQHHWPCGKCVSVCPVGDDMKVYRGSEIVSKEGIKHCQSFGS